MLETLNQDYVRTARAKGLSERTVIMRHAFRNALIPVTTLMAFDFGDRHRRRGDHRDGFRLAGHGPVVRQRPAHRSSRTP